MLRLARHGRNPLYITTGNTGGKRPLAGNSCRLTKSCCNKPTYTRIRNAM